MSEETEADAPKRKPEALLRKQEAQNACHYRVRVAAAYAMRAEAEEVLENAWYDRHEIERLLERVEYNDEAVTQVVCTCGTCTTYNPEAE